MQKYIDISTWEAGHHVTNCIFGSVVVILFGFYVVNHLSRIEMLSDAICP